MEKDKDTLSQNEAGIFRRHYRSRLATTNGLVTVKRCHMSQTRNFVIVPSVSLASGMDIFNRVLFVSMKFIFVSTCIDVY